MPRIIGLLLAFSAVMAVIAFRPGGEGAAVALLQTETPTSTTEPSSTSTSTATTASPTATATVTRTPAVTPTPGPVANPVINFPTSACQGGFPPSSANVTFTWTGPTNVSQIYLDLSAIDNNFVDGTYTTFVLSPGTTSLTRSGLQAAVAYLWRVTGLGLNGDWVTSDVGQFTPCGTQRLLDLTYTCTGGGRATVTFRWAPASSPAFFQFLDLTLFNNNFVPGTFLGLGPMAPTQQAQVWPGIIANAIHYFRVNTFSFFGWTPSGTGSFVAQC